MENTVTSTTEFCNLPNNARFVFDGVTYVKIHNNPWECCNYVFGHNARVVGGDLDGSLAYIARSETVEVK